MAACSTKRASKAAASNRPAMNPPIAGLLHFVDALQKSLTTFHNVMESRGQTKYLDTVFDRVLFC
jgi:hypothetical protein